MAKKSVKEESPTNSAHKKFKPLQVMVFIILILVILSLVIFILLSKSSGLKNPCEIAGMKCYDSCPEGYEQASHSCKEGAVCCKKVVQKSACEQYGNTCRNNSCPASTMKVDMACSQSAELCCRNLSTYEGPCEAQGNICFNTVSAQGVCPNGYGPIDLGCILGEICCKKIPTPCETRGYTCKDSCAEIEKTVNFDCTTGQTCCQYKIANRNDCEDEGYQCHYSSCKTGFEKAGMCTNDYVCCKRDTNPNKLFVYGFVKLKQGNCMPPVDSSTCTLNNLDTEAGVFRPVSQLDMDGLYYRSAIEPLQFQRTVKNGITGYYEMDFLPGTYSIFAKDPLGGQDYYCNQFSGDGKACTFTITNASVKVDIIIDHATY